MNQGSCQRRRGGRRRKGECPSHTGKVGIDSRGGALAMGLRTAFGLGGEGTWGRSTIGRTSRGNRLPSGDGPL